MSVILITQHNENIYDVIKFMENEETVRETKGPADKKASVHKVVHLKKRGMYKSKHSTINDFYKRCRKLHATMGIPEEEPPDPARFLKKHTGKPLQSHPCKPPENEDDELAKLKPKQAKVPTLEELRKEPREKRVPRNFIDRNIKKVTSMKAKEPEERQVLDRLGTSKPLKAGLEPVFIKLPEFGTRPKYLIKFIHIQNKSSQMHKDETVVEVPKCRYITKEEREQLLNGLKQNWEELQKHYQGLPILTDTIPKVNRKVKIENDLKQIEKDIVLVERHPYIYVYDDNDLQKC